MHITKEIVAKILIWTRIAVLIAGVAGSAVGTAFAATGAGMAPEQTEVSASDSDAANLPIKPRELLLRMKSAMEQGELLNDDFYNNDNLAQFFGMGYRFTPREEDDGRKTIYLDTGSNAYFDRHGEPTLLGRNRPCLQRGSLSFEGGGPRRKAKAGISITTSAGDAYTSAISADLVREIFGVPAVKPGYPSAPPLHGLPYQPSPKTDPQGNLWLIYETELDGHAQYMRFRTLGDATVIEIQLSEEQR